MHSFVEVFEVIKKKILIVKKKLVKSKYQTSHVISKTNKYVARKNSCKLDCLETFGETKVKKNKKIINENDLKDVLELFF